MRIIILPHELSAILSIEKLNQSIFAQDEIGFGRITDTPKDAVDLIVRGLGSAISARLRPTCISS